MGIKVRELAHARTGDKGDISDIGVFAYNTDSYHILHERLTDARVEAAFEPIADGPVTRYELPQLDAFNFVIENALSGGVTTSSRLDSHGKSLSYLLLDIEIEIHD